MHVQHGISMKQLLEKLTIFFSIKTNFIKTDGLSYKNDLFFTQKKEFIWTYEYMIIHITLFTIPQNIPHQTFFLLVFFWGKKKSTTNPAFNKNTLEYHIWNSRFAMHWPNVKIITKW